MSLRLSTDNAVIVDYDALGGVAAEAAASRPYGENTLTLASPGGIARVELRAEQTCLVKVCWCCELPMLPDRFRRADGNDGQ